MRQSQATRRELTRGQLLEATADCLADLGWSGTSTVEVAKRAGVSRGAQQHHYPTKIDLVVAAAHHLLASQREQFERTFMALPLPERTPGAAIDLLWTMFRGRAFRALFELSVATRTVDALATGLGDLTAMVVESLLDSARRLLPEISGDPRLPIFARSIIALFTGLALQTDGVNSAAGKAEVVALFRNIATDLLGRQKSIDTSASSRSIGPAGNFAVSPKTTNPSSD